MSGYRTQTYTIELGKVIGDILQYRSDLGFLDDLSQPFSGTNPPQKVFMGLVGMTPLDTEILTNGIWINMEVTFYSKLFSLKTVIPGPIETEKDKRIKELEKMLSELLLQDTSDEISENSIEEI